MASRWMAVGLLVTALADVAVGETVTWQAVVLDGPGDRRVIADGVKTYAPETDIVVREVRRPGDPVSWLKSLPLGDSFAVGASVARERGLDGFGLWVRRGDENGFSWNWFERTRGAEFRKLQGPGRVSITVRQESDHEELASVEFLDDVALSYLDDMRKAPGTRSHEVIIRKGSIIRFAAAATAPEASPPAARDFIIRSGVMERAGAARNRLRQTDTITMDPSRRPGWCFLVDPPTDEPYEVYSIHHLPVPPTQVMGTFDDGLKTKAERVVGGRLFCFDFNDGDPLGEYRIDVFVDGVLKDTLRVGVVPADPADGGGRT